MRPQSLDRLPDLYLADETAWLDEMVRLIQEARFEQLDYKSLEGYLSDAAARDRREVFFLLKDLLTRVLLWTYDPNFRTRRDGLKILRKQHELHSCIEESSLRTHAHASLAEAYEDAVELVAIQIGDSRDSFPTACPYALDELLSFNMLLP